MNIVNHEVCIYQLTIRQVLREVFANIGATAENIDLVVVTDGEGILGIGDWGVGGINIAIGKLAVYTAAVGIDPSRVLPVILDVGTNREELLDNPFYIGNRHPRITGEAYDEFIDTFVQAVNKQFRKRFYIGKTSVLVMHEKF